MKLSNSNINRSPTAYDNNPEDERRRYSDGNTNKDMITLRIDSTDGKPMGSISWFSVHTTSVSNQNVYIHGDNKGIASYLFEKLKNGEQSLPGTGSFTAAFPIPPSGDISPNIRGAFCPNRQPCDRNSTCGGNSNLCHGIGPGKDDIDSAMIIGRNQFEAAVKAFEEAKQEVKGSIDYRHIYVNMTTVKVDPKYTSTGRQESTCRNALGMSFAAGTTDGPGGFNFHQGNNHSSNPFWNIIRDFVSKPTPEQIECQKPKPIFLDVAAKLPYPWQPQILPMSVFKLGNVLFVNLPGEFSTMAGRRIEEQVKRTAVAEGLIPEREVVVVLTTMSNAYIQYSTTFEEYIVQRYEGASTVFGPHTNSAYTQEIDKLVIAMAKNQQVPKNPNPPDLSIYQISLNPGVVLDTHPPQKPFGSVHAPPKDSYKIGETVVVEFWSGHLDNNFLNVETYLTIDKFVDGQWVVIKKDSDLNTRIRWRRQWRNVIFPDSRVIIDWKIDEHVAPGRYRITHYGWAKENAVSGKLTPYQGSTNPFSVSN